MLWVRSAIPRVHRARSRSRAHRVAMTPASSAPSTRGARASFPVVPRVVPRRPARRRASASTMASASASRAVMPPPPATCAEAASRARVTIRNLREMRARDADVARETARVRVELPLPSIDLGSDALAYVGLHGQASDWSGGMSQRYRRTRSLLETNAFDGYEFEYHGMLDRDAEGMGLWTLGDFALVTTHPSDTTFAFFERLLSGEYGGRVGGDDGRMLIVVNAFWSGKGEKVGQPWEFGLRRRAKELLSEERGDFEKVYACRRARSASGVEGTLLREWPGPWRLFDAHGERVVGEWDDEPSNRVIAETLNDAAGVEESAGFHRNAADTSRANDCIT